MLDVPSMGGVRHCEPNARCSQLSTHEAELLAALHAHSAWTDWISTLRPEDMHMHEWPAESERGLHRTASRLWFQREASRLWFNVVTSNDAQYEDNDSNGDNNGSMPDLSVSDNSDTEDDDDIPDLVPFEDEVETETEFSVPGCIRLIDKTRRRA